MVFDIKQAWPRWIAGLLNPRDGDSNSLPRADALNTNEVRLLLYFVQLGRCIWCGEIMTFTRCKYGQPARDFATFEHFKRKQDGGKFFCDNIALAHRFCNNKREIDRQEQIGSSQMKMFR